VRLRHGLIVFPLAASVVVGAAASPASPSDHAGRAGATRMAAASGTLRIAQVESGVPEAFDPALLGDNRTIELAQNVWEGLLDINEKFQVVPQIARSWSVSKSGLVYTFHLRKNVRFQNGDPVTAQDFIYTYTRSLLPATASDTSFFLTDIAGANAVNSGKAKTVSGLKARDPYTLQVTLTHRAGYFPSLVSRWPAWVVDSKVVEKDGKNWVKPGNSVGTGAYKLVKQVGNTEYDFQANAGYWGTKPTIQNVNWSAVADSTAALARYQSGQFDVVLNLSAASVLQVQQDPTLKSQFHSRPLLRTVWLAWQTNKPPFNDKRVRLAFAHAIDRNLLVKVALSGQATPGNGWLPPGLPGNVNSTRKPYAMNVDLARKYLAQAGFPEGKGFPKLDIYFKDSLGSQQQLFELIQAQLKQNLGISLGLKNTPVNAFDEMVDSPKKRPLLYGYTFGFDYPDAQEADEYLRVTGAPYNYENYSNKRYDALVGQANSSSDASKRAKLYAQAENILMNDLGVLPLYYPNTNWLAKPNVKNFALTALYMRKWNTISLGK
jgi:oligopeptide transport system substrate-binding protein